MHNVLYTQKYSIKYNQRRETGDHLSASKNLARVSVISEVDYLSIGMTTRHVDIRLSNVFQFVTHFWARYTNTSRVPSLSSAHSGLEYPPVKMPYCSYIYASPGYRPTG